MVCQECHNYKMRIKQQRDSSNMFIACTGYPGCKAVINLPKGLTGVLMLDQVCSECQQQGLTVRLLKLDFDSNFVNEPMQEVLPYEDNTSGHFCVLSDESFFQLLEAAKNIPNRKNFYERLNKNEGVPQYYYEKPETGEIPKKRQVKEAAVLIGKEGCPCCNKKRHSKNSMCPNAQ